MDRGLVPAGQPPPRRVRLAAAVLAGQQATGERAPDQDPDALVDGDRHQLVLGLPSLQGVVDLLADEPWEAVAIGDAKRCR
jgi:hypothetical protein